MRNLKFILLVALVGIAFSSCKKDVEYRLGDLQALWLENSTQHYVRFTDEQSDQSGYFYGREWDDADWNDPDMTHEEFLIQERKTLGHPGDGWFKYQLETKGDLHEIHLMNNEGAVIPKEYILSKLTSSELEYYEKDNKNNKFSFTKK